MAVKETLTKTYGEEDFFFSDGDGSGSLTKSGVWYQLTAVGYRPLVAIRLDNKSDLNSVGLVGRALMSTPYYGLMQVVKNITEPVRVSEVRLIFHKMPYLDSGIGKN